MSEFTDDHDQEHQEHQHESTARREPGDLLTSGDELSEIIMGACLYRKCQALIVKNIESILACLPNGGACTALVWDEHDPEYTRARIHILKILSDFIKSNGQTGFTRVPLARFDWILANDKEFVENLNRVQQSNLPLGIDTGQPQNNPYKEITDRVRSLIYFEGLELGDEQTQEPGSSTENRIYDMTRKWLDDSIFQAMLLDDFNKSRIELSDSTARTKISHALESASLRVNSVAETRSAALSPENPNKELIPLERVSAGIPWLDTLFGGGLPRKSAGIFLAPTGGGKTTIGIQIAMNGAKAGTKTAYFSYEQTTESGDIAERIRCLQTGLTRDQVVARTRTINPQDYIDAVVEAENTWFGLNTSVHDMTRPGTGLAGVQDVIDFVTAEAHQDRAPEIVVIDWYGQMINKYIGANNIDQADVTITMSTQMEKLALAAEELGTTFLVLHQLDTKSQRINDDPAPHKADRCKNLGNYCRFAMGITSLKRSDREILGRLCITKNTSGNLAEHVVRLNPALCVFEQVSRQWDGASGAFVENPHPDASDNDIIMN